ncbi:rhomboid family intramembrane serine protease [Moraxella sp. VT-16-12]|uniref:rhomboid family intramembrane serine protease n=1 Tax=Moraxella sp. VT-16-12 TaxID=2014877 RepID=UPI000B7F24FA|nr:rhomboid family intramembrane serine protease [Moraxella sp. VT-16-12]TWV83986.1 rhomboid family intramembrane serine protease [Moraxella sp. VT-16-12]
MTHTLVIIIMTVIVSLLAWQSPAFLNRLVFDPLMVKKGQIDRFITYGFIHAHGWHLFFNMFTLFFFGQAIERLYIAKFGYLGFLGFYVAAIIFSVLPDFIKSGNGHTRTVLLGASGGVSAVLFAFVLLAPWQLIYFFAVIPVPAIIFAILYVAYSIYAYKKGNDNIGHLAHMAGAVFGVVATIAIEPALLLHFIGELLNPKF